MVCCLEAKIVKTSCYCFLKIIVSSLKKYTVVHFNEFFSIIENLNFLKNIHTTLFKSNQIALKKIVKENCNIVYEYEQK